MRDMRGNEHKAALSIADFCAATGLDRTRVYQELASGRLRGKKVGTRTIIAADEVAAWLARLPTFDPAWNRIEQS